MAKLEDKLSTFASTHQQQLQQDPVFRQRFLEMCAPLGLDPLQSRKTLWGGMGDFYHELAVKVAEVCLASRRRNGGIMSLTEIQTALAHRHSRFGISASQKRAQVSQADILVAIRKLAPLGGGFRTLQVGNQTMVVSVPTELDQDHTVVLQVCHGHTAEYVRETTGWEPARVDRALTLLLQEGMAWVDKVHGETRYGVPSLWQAEREAEESAE